MRAAWRSDLISQSANWHGRKLEGNTNGQWILVVEAFMVSKPIEPVTKLAQEINISPRLVVVSRVLIVNIKSIKSIIFKDLN